MADDELLVALSSLVRTSNEVTAEFLVHLAELDERQLYLDLGFSSLFEYCTVSLGLSESAAGRRTVAAQVCRKYPEAIALVASGALHLSALCSLKQHLNPASASELFALCSRKSARKSAELLAARFPMPDVRDSIRRLPPTPTPTLDVGSNADNARSAAAKAQNLPAIPTPSANREPNSFLPPMPTRSRTPARVDPLSADRFGVRFTADTEFLELLERVRGLTAHRLPNGDLLTLFKRALQAHERELEKERFAVGRRPRAPRHKPPEQAEHRSPPQFLEFPIPSLTAKLNDGLSLATPSTLKRSRHHPAAVAREVFVRDGKRCTYVSADGRRCTANEFLELDHIKPWALGGKQTPENLRLRCRPHNQRHAQQCFGKAHMQAARARAKQRPNGTRTTPKPKAQPTSGEGSAIPRQSGATRDK